MARAGRSNCAVAAGLAALCLASGPAFADCKGLNILAQVDLAGTGDIRPYVPVSFGGKTAIMLVDTGGSRSQMTPAMADALGLKRGMRDFHLSQFGGRASKDIVREDVNPEVYDLTGSYSNELVHTAMTLGGLTASNMALYVMPKGIPFSGEPEAAGLIASDVLASYDVEIDFGARKLNLLSPDHCEGKVVYWQSDAIAVVPFHKMRSGHIQFTVQLDGKDVVADLDTGARDTMLTTGAAASLFGVAPGAADAPRIGSLKDNGDGPIYRHSFKSLDIGGVVISNPSLVLFPDLTRMARENAGAPPLGSRLSDSRVDESGRVMRIGMDILKHLHIYIAYGEEKLYITAAGTHA